MAEDDAYSDTDSIARVAECPVCKDECASRLLPSCQHGVCETCITRMASNDSIKCPLCSKVSSIPCGDVDRLSRNFTALQIKEKAARIKERKRLEEKQSYGMRLIINLPHGTPKPVFVQKADSTVDDLRDVIKEATGIPETCQRLIYLGRELENGKPVSFYNLKANHTITLVEKEMQFIITTLQNNKIAKQVKTLSCTVEKLKKMIEDDTGIPEENYKLQWNGRELERGNTLASYNMIQGNTNPNMHMVQRVHGGEFL